MLSVNEKDFPPLKTATANKLAQHNYAAPVPMETTRPSNQSVRRTLNATPTKLPPTKKLATENEPSLADVLAAIKALDNKVEDLGKQVKENSDMFVSIIQRIELNSAEITECKSKVNVLEKEHADLYKQNAELKEKLLEVERYKRRWNLRLSGLKEKEGENIREKIEELLLQIIPQWKDEIHDVIDSVHRVGRREDKRNRQIIMQFIRRHHRDAVWKTTKDSPICKGQGLQFMQDFTQEDRQAREELWPKIKQARSMGKVAYYKGHIAVIDGHVVKS